MAIAQPSDAPAPVTIATPLAKCDGLKPNKRDAKHRNGNASVRLKRKARAD